MTSEQCIRRSDCRLCSSTDLELAIELTPTPPANAFVRGDCLDIEQPKFPLDVYFCNSCSHVQLLDVVDPEYLFSEYVYLSGTSPIFIDHFRRYANQILSQFKPKPQSLVIDIGSNDGTLLSFFKEAGMSVLGIDPAKSIAEKTSNKGIETWDTFFDQEVANKINNLKGKASIITANNVFAHADDLKDIIQGIRSLLAPDGIFAFEVSYLADVISDTLFDTIYHEHLSYHSVEPLREFFKKNGMHMFSAYRVTTHGGSLRGICQLSGGSYEDDGSVSKLILQERSSALNDIHTYKSFAENIQKLKNDLNALLRTIKSEGQSIAGYGAPAKATTLMYHFGLGRETIDFIVDDSPLKQGLYSPGEHILIAPSSDIQKFKPNFLLVFAWNFADAIIRNNKTFSDSGGQFILPLPNVKVC